MVVPAGPVHVAMLDFLFVGGAYIDDLHIEIQLHAGERVVASMQQRVRRRIPVDWDDARRGHG